MPSSKRPLVLIAALVVAIGAAGAIYLFVGEEERHTIDGAVLLLGAGNIDESGENCKGEQAYADLMEGAPVTLRDERDRVLAAGTLSAEPRNLSTCGFEFSLSNVPDRSSYRLQIALQEPVEVTREFLEGSDWVIEVVWGDLDQGASSWQHHASN